MRTVNFKIMIKINYIARTWTLLLVMKLIQSLADRITFVPFFESESLLFCQNAIKKKFPVHHKINRTRSKKKPKENSCEKARTQHLIGIGHFSIQLPYLPFDAA